MVPPSRQASVARTAASHRYPELQLRDGDEVFLLIQSRVEDQMDARCNPDILGEQNPPVGLESVLIPYRPVEDLFDRAHVQQAGCPLSFDAEGIEEGGSDGEVVFREGAGYTSSLGGVVGIAGEAYPAVPLSLAMDPESSAGLVG